jgi:hypothetical protein
VRLPRQGVEPATWTVEVSVEPSGLPQVWLTPPVGLDVTLPVVWDSAPVYRVDRGAWHARFAALLAGPDAVAVPENATRLLRVGSYDVHVNLPTVGGNQLVRTQPAAIMVG